MRELQMICKYCQAPAQFVKFLDTYWCHDCRTDEGVMGAQDYADELLDTLVKNIETAGKQVFKVIDNEET